MVNKECVICNGSLKADPDPDKFNKNVKVCEYHLDEFKKKLRVRLGLDTSNL
jgi:hypothetical protein